MLFTPSWITDALPSNSKIQVAHYTRIGTLRYFTDQAKPGGWCSVWATPVQFLNDRKELSLGLDTLSRVANQPPYSGHRVRLTLDSLINLGVEPDLDPYQVSFSGNVDELGQWRGYAANGMGCSVVTKTADVQRVADVAGWVIYDARKQLAFARKILQTLRKQTDVAIIEQVLIASACFMKDKGFEPEAEFRLLKFPTPGHVQFRESGDRLVPYIDVLATAAPLPIIKVIVGPGWQLSELLPDAFARHHVVQGIHRLLTARGMPGDNIHSSTIPYDPK